MKKKKIILIPDRISIPDVEKEVFGDDFEIISPCSTNALDIDDNIWSNADAILAWHDLMYNEEIIEKLTSCKVIVRVGVGYDNVDLEATKRRKIIVCNVPDYGTNDVADHTIALMLSLARGIERYNHEVKYNNRWEWNIDGGLRRLTGSTLGIIGLGRIGTATVLRAKAFGMNITFYDPYVPAGKDKALQITRVDLLYDLLERADIVSIHTPLTDETKTMVNKEFFNNIKKKTIIINTARGQIIELDALYHALRNNAIKAAGLDVLPQEPPDKNHPLIKAWQNDEDWLKGRFIITPHSAFYNKESYIEMRKKAAEEAQRVLEGVEAKNRVDNFPHNII